MQKNQIPFAAVGRDHGCEQENKTLKIEGGIKGITRSDSARTEYISAAPTLIEITREMRIMVGLKMSQKVSIIN